MRKFLLVVMLALTLGLVMGGSTGYAEEASSKRIEEVVKQHNEIVKEWKDKPILNVRKERPRLLPPKTDIPKLKERLKWLRFDEWEKTGRIKYWKGSSLPLLYYISGEKKYKEIMLSNLAELLKKDPSKGTFLTNPSVVSGIAVIYDVLHGELTEEQRKEVRGKMIEIADACMLGRVSGAGCYMSLGYHNGFYVQLAALGRAGYALYGDDPKGEEYIKRAYELFLREVIPAILHPGKGVVGGRGPIISTLLFPIW